MPSGLSVNEEALLRVYDPAYVRQVSLPEGAGPVQVCLDSRMLGVEAGTGVATYAAVLARCLGPAGAAAAVLDDGRSTSASPGRPRLSRWVSALDRTARQAEVRGLDRKAPDLSLEAAGWSVPDVFREAQVFFNLHGELMPIACAQPPQVMHWTYPVPLYVQGARNLYTVHDLIPLTDPGLTTINPARHRRLLQQIIRHAHGLVTVSQTMRATIVVELGCDPDFVTNTYQAAITPLQSDPPLPAGLKSGAYFLFCGTVEPRKNLARLIHAHAASGASLPLVIVGPEARGAEALEAEIAAADRVVRLPWQPHAMLLGLLRRARALLYPSLAEGFGLPIVEAMSLGTPVLTADRGATAEIGGSAARLVDPTDAAALSEAIAELAAFDQLCARLRRAGLERARLFAPPAYQRRLRSLYAATLAMSAPPGVSSDG